MIAILQRVSEASVEIDGVVTGAVGKGYMILLGVAKGDTELDGELLAEKISKLRIFEDESGKMNLSVNDVAGGVLVVPNFTLLASYRRGNRPDFMGSERPEEARRLFDHFCNTMEKLVSKVARGTFGAHMHVSLLNDGPITIPMDSAVLRQPKKQAHSAHFEETL